MATKAHPTVKAYKALASSYKKLNAAMARLEKEIAKPKPNYEKQGALAASASACMQVMDSALGTFDDATVS